MADPDAQASRSAAEASRSAVQSPRPDADLSEVDLLLRLARRWRRLGAEAMDEHDLSPHQERGLLAVARLVRRAEQDDPAGVRISHLAHHLGIAPRSATEVADSLEAAGLVERSPDPTDRRAVLLSLTDTGRHAVARVRDRRRSAAEEAMGALDPKDRTELRRILMRLLAD